MNVNSPTLGLRSGRLKRAVAESSNVPNVTGTVVLPAAKDVLTPVKLNVAVPPPDCKVMELPEPVQETREPHLKEPVALTDVLKTRSPPGRMVKGSA